MSLGASSVSLQAVVCMCVYVCVCVCVCVCACAIERQPDTHHRLPAVELLCSVIQAYKNAITYKKLPILV